MPFFKAIIIASFLSLFVFVGCKNSENNLIPASQNENAIKRDLPEEFKTYWYDGTAEITSYDLMQERYGELRKGKAVNIFVTEDFLSETQVKADNDSEKNIPVLKLNQVKNLINSFQILDESYREDVYRANIKIVYNEKNTSICIFFSELGLDFFASISRMEI